MGINWQVRKLEWFLKCRNSLVTCKSWGVRLYPSRLNECKLYWGHIEWSCKGHQDTQTSYREIFIIKVLLENLSTYLGIFPIMWKLWKYFWIIINENKFALLVSVSTCKELDHHHTIHQQVKSSANLKINNSSRMCKRGKDTGQITISKVQKTGRNRWS